MVNPDDGNEPPVDNPDERNPPNNDSDGDEDVSDEEVDEEGDEEALDGRQPDPAQLLKDRTNKRRAFTTLSNRIREQITGKGPLETISEAFDRLANLYEEALAAHLQYCGATNKEVETWVAALDEAMNETTARFKTGEAAREENRRKRGRGNSPASLGGLNESVSVAGSGSRASARSARSGATNVSRTSARSILSTLSQQRKDAERELELIQQRREEDQEDEKRLRQLQEKLAELSRRMSDRKRERQIEEEVARLRRSEDMARKLTQEEIGADRRDSDLEDTFARSNQRVEERESKPAQRRVQTGQHDDWISNLSERRASRSTGESSARYGTWNAPGAAYACAKPFDGDPRDWPLFSSRFKALVHDALPDDAQRVAVLADWLGPNVRRRLETLLTAPQGYAAALEFLREQYGKPEKVSRCRIIDLLSLPACKLNDLPSLQAFSDQLHGTVVVLQQAGNEHDLKSEANREQLVQKLPVPIRSRWARFVLRLPRSPDLADLSQLLRDVVEEERLMRPTEESLARASSTSRDAQRARDRPPKPANKSNYRSDGSSETRRPSAPAPSTFPATILATQVEADAQLGCLACGTQHASSSCTVFKGKSPDERAQLAKEAGYCFRCLKGRHRSANCGVKTSCNIEGCKARHHSLLHGAERVYPARRPESRRAAAESTDSASERCVNAVAPESAVPETMADVLLAVVPVRLLSGGRAIDTYALLDSGSEATLIRKDAAEQLALKGYRKTTKFATFQGSDPAVETELVSFVVASTTGNRAYAVSGAYVVPHLNVGRRRAGRVPPALNYLRDLALPTQGTEEVKVLIGMDVQDVHLPLDVRRPPIGVHGPNAIRTPFGWCLVGRLPRVDNDGTGRGPSVLHVSIDPLQRLEETVEQFWRTQAMPVKEAPRTFMAHDDRIALEHFQATIRHTGSRYEVGLPVKDSIGDLPENRDAVRRRFLAFERRLRRDPEACRAVNEAMEETIRSGHAALVVGPQPARTWYLPFHAVRNPNKPGKVRVVFNAAARFKGIGLNDVLRKGPDLTTQLLAVLVRFRERRVAVTADIRRMFYQVLVPPADRPLFRFFWRRLGSEAGLEEYEMAVHIFGAVSSPAVCNFALQRLVDDSPDELKEVTGRITSDFYVDNLLAAFDDEGEAADVCRKLVRLLSLGGFELTQFLSLSWDVLSRIPAPARAAPELDLDLDGLPTERTLGYLWSCQADAFVFSPRPAPDANSKRELLSAVSTVYDPLGLLAPVILVAKIILQDIWRLKLDWDEPVPSDITTRWRRWCTELPALEELAIPRSHLDQPRAAYHSIQLHAFADASKDGFGAALYLRTEDDRGVSVRLAMAKARVAPVHQLTIPKLELQAALMATRLVSFYVKQSNLNIDAVTYWSDAMVVIRWVNSSHRRFVTFVANRISEMLEVSEPAQWRHVPGELNPADELSRGLWPTELTQDHRWFNGPEFLAQPPEHWPSTVDAKDFVSSSEELVECLALKDDDGPVDALIERTSNLHRLVRIAAWINRFIARARKKRSMGDEAEPLGAPLNIGAKSGRQLDAQEYQRARHTLVRVAQLWSFADEITHLRKGRPLRRESRLLQLTPFLDSQGLLRVGGRLHHAPLSFEARHPLILDPHHSLTRLIVRWAHLSVGHGRADRTLAEVRGRYWVLSGRAAAKSTITRCYICARERARPPQPLMAPLPEDRVRPFRRPFASTGVDYFGPLFVTIGRRREKRYGVIFTCLVTRAVHLELASSLDTDSFLLAFSRFVGRRCAPTDVWSDNGTNLRAGERELREAVARLNGSRVPEQLAAREIVWHFSPPSAPHFGGVWERLVRSCKNAIHGILGDRAIKEEILTTVLVQTEALLNNRPLTHVGADPEELEPLTPNHFLAGGPNPHVPADVVGPSESCFRQRWRHAQQLLDQVWRRWLREYLPTLNTRRKWQSNEPSLNVDDIVLVVDPNSPRGHWPLGRVVAVMPGPDGIVRTVQVRTKTGTYVRPVARLCRLEALDAADAAGPAVSRRSARISGDGASRGQAPVVG